MKRHDAFLVWLLLIVMILVIWAASNERRQATAETVASGAETVYSIGAKAKKSPLPRSTRKSGIGK